MKNSFTKNLRLRVSLNFFFFFFANPNLNSLGQEPDCSRVYYLIILFNLSISMRLGDFFFFFFSFRVFIDFIVGIIND